MIKNSYVYFSKCILIFLVTFICCLFGVKIPVEFPFKFLFLLIQSIAHLFVGKKQSFFFSMKILDRNN